MPNQKQPQMGVAPRQASVRHPHDLGGTRTYSQPLGMMLPVFHQTLNPRECVDLSVLSNTQMMTLKGRAFAGFRQRFAAFFVKNHDTWSFWDSFITNIPLNNTIHSSKMVFNSSIVGQPNSFGGYALPSQVQNYNVLPAVAPNANVYETVHVLMEHYYLYELYKLNAFSPSNNFAARAWANFVSYLSSSGALPTSVTVSWSTNQSTYLPSTFVHPTDSFGYPLGPSAERLCEFLGFGCVRPTSIVCKLLYDYYISYMSSQDEANALIDNYIYGSLYTQFLSQHSLVTYDSSTNVVSFDLNSFVAYGFSTSMLLPHPKLQRKRDIFKLLAYQKVYSDYFRNEDYEPFDPLIQNVDYYFDNVSLDTDLSIDWKSKVANDLLVFFNPLKLSQDDYTLIKLLTPRYAHYGLDYVTNIKPSPMYTFATPSLPADVLGAYGGMFNNTSYSVNGAGYHASPAGGSTTAIKGYSTLTQFPTNVTEVGVSTSNGLTPQSLRAMLALEKIAKLSASARRNYSSQIQAVYGVTPATDTHTSIFINSVAGNANVVPVVATADGSTSDSQTNFGQQGSYVDGVAQGSLCNKFVAPDFGELIVFSWLETNAPFDANFVDPMVSKLYPADFFHPEFANLGMQPFMTETIDQSLDGCIGFQVRYSEYKCGRDIAFGDFQSDRNKSFMLPHRLCASNILGNVNVFSLNEQNPIDNYPTGNKISYVRLFMISPATTDALTEIKYDGTTETDPCDVHSSFKCTIIRDMNENGEPIL